MSNILEILNTMLEQVRTEANKALQSNDKKKALKILRQVNKILPKQFQNELLE